MARQRIGRGLGGGSILTALLTGVFLLVGAGVAWALITVNLILEVETDTWEVWAPGPSGVAQKNSTTMLVVDTDRNNYPEWEDDGINLWEITLTGEVIRTGALSFREPTGASFDQASGTLYVSSDSESAVFAIQAGNDGLFGTNDDAENEIFIGGSDIEDPAFDPATGDLFVLNGGNSGVIYRVDMPSEVVQANPIDISDYGADWEGLAITPSGELLAGNNLGQEIHVFDKDGNHLQVIDLAGDGPLRISGLAVSTPGAGGDDYDIWVADRHATCNCDDPDNIDGRVWRFSTDGSPPLPTSTTTTTQPSTTTTTGGTTTTTQPTTTTTQATTTTTASTTTTTQATTTTTTIPGTTTTTTQPGGGGGGGNTNPFTDDDGSVFESSIEWLAAQGITQGCNPPANTRFCPNARVTRGQMATFLVRAMGYPNTSVDYFIDDENSVFEGAINRLRSAGVTQGCNPPANDRFCPDSHVTRGQMAAFLVRAFGFDNGAPGDFFIDDDDSVFEAAIDKLRVAGVTLGCNPPANDRYCPDDYVTRGQMAAFLRRAFGG